MEHRRVIASAESLADVGQAHLSELFGKSHRDLARAGHVARAPFGIHLGDLNLVVIGDGLLDVFD